MAFTSKLYSPSDEDQGIIGIPYTDDWQFRRLEAITEGSRPVDPWERRNRGDFHLSAHEIIYRAKRAAPKAPVPTVSAFAAWIYSLYHKDAVPESLQEGSDAEESILEARRDWTSYSEFRHFQFSSWHQIHCGMGAPNAGDRQQTFLVPDLRVNGEPLQAIPDLAFRHEDSGDVILIEVKFSMAFIPRNLWPNVWAQLWAYSKIPVFASAPSLNVIGEVWGQNVGNWCKPDLSSPVYLRSSVKRDPRDAKFDRFFWRLFSLYSGSADLQCF